MSERHEFLEKLGTAESRSRRAWFSSTALQREITKLRLAVADAAVKATRQSMLMREADHRIKNSLQLVASLVRSASRREQPSVTNAANAVAVRIDEIANLHDLLQLSPGSDVVDLGALLHRVRLSLETVIAVEPRRIEIMLDAGPILAPADFARPVVMSVSELVMNALRHAFPDGRRGTVRISAVEVAGSLRVVVADDGVGLPSEPVDGAGFGMKLVRAMAGQIGGTLLAENDGGARFTLAAPLPRR